MVREERKQRRLKKGKIPKQTNTHTHTQKRNRANEISRER
jgi:hypothetical protein